MYCNYKIELYVSDKYLAKILFESNHTHLLYNRICKAITDEHAREFIFSQLEPIAKEYPMPFFYAAFTYDDKVDHLYMVNGDVKIFATYEEDAYRFEKDKTMFKVCAR